MPPHPSKVLLLRLSSIGDIVLTTPFLRIFKTHYPNTKVHYVVRKEYAGLLQWNPYIDTLITVDIRSGRKGLEELNQTLRAEQYDAVFDLHNHFRTRLIRNGLSRYIYTINKRAFRRLLLVSTHINAYQNNVPVAERYIEAAKEYGLTADGKSCELFFPNEIQTSALHLLKEQGWDAQSKLIGLCPGSRHFTKRWPIEKYVQLTDLLLWHGYAVAIFGSTEDTEAGEKLQNRDPGRVYTLCGKATLLETAAMLAHCSVVTANDSGLMHIATAVHRPVVAIFGSTVREFGFFPYNSNSQVFEVNGLSCRPCTSIGRSSCPRKHFKCMIEISAEDVFEAVHGMVE